ncbi:MAG: SGNH/GDSL hydrolase family protein [Actinocatenispora sp.]
MTLDPVSRTENTDPHCLAPGVAERLLAGHPWRRFVVLGDSVAEGLGDPVPGYTPLSWADRMAAELTVVRPDLAYLNLGRRETTAAQIRATQLAPALEFGPDLALVCCGGNDAISPFFKADAVREDLTAIVSGLRGVGAEVLTLGYYDLHNCPAIRPMLRAGVSRRMRTLAGLTAQLAATRGAIHVDLTEHPSSAESNLYSADGLHGNGRSHAIAAAVTIRLLGARLGNE